jgi:hypothetical protein
MANQGVLAAGLMIDTWQGSIVGPIARAIQPSGAAIERQRVLCGRLI